ncbi:MAG: hypothetical protein ACKPKO_15020, partial [Candidatus Fonsibacter sp.]
MLINLINLLYTFTYHYCLLLYVCRFLHVHFLALYGLSLYFISFNNLIVPPFSCVYFHCIHHF